MTTFYKYQQNNSGGVFRGPAMEVYIEASSPEEADSIATYKTEIYFDDDYSIDCDCCGTRWSRASDWDEVEESEIDEESVSEFRKLRAKRDKIPAQIFVRKD